jgi:hypothetical protein
MGEYDQHLLRKQEQFKKECVLKLLFDLGQIVGTPGALQALIEVQQPPDELLTATIKEIGETYEMKINKRTSYRWRMVIGYFQPMS